MNLIRKLQSRKMEGRSQPLNSKDTETFQQALSLYEKKEYPKALAEVNAIIKRRKEKVHGESLCLKGLIMYHLKQDNDEARRLMNEGTKADAKSPVAWHMCGIFHKLQQEYTDAHKAYIQSYKLKKDNPNVHQDLAMLSAQQRDYATLVDVRRQSLAQRMSLRMAWTSLAAAQYLKKDFVGVEKTVELYEQIMMVEKSSSPAKTGQEKLSDEIEISELLMLRNRAILSQPGQEKRALEDLEDIKPRIRDQLAWQENRALLLARINPTQGRQAYMELLERNSDNAEYYKALEKLVPAKEHPEMYADLAAKFPKADLPLSRPLTIFSADSSDYADRVETYLKTKLSKIVPSTFMLVKSLYLDQEKQRVMREVVESKLQLGADVPSTVFLARHYSYTDRQTKAVELLEQLDTSAEDEDTKVDVQMAYAELLQRAGDFTKAATTLHTVSDSVPGDRYLNTKAASAYFRAGNLDEGYKQAYKFPRLGKHAESDQEALKYLVAMESVNVLVEAAEAHFRCRDHGMALKRATQVMEIMHSYYREQYDFHFYGPKRGTLRAYVDMVSWADDLYSHPVYFRALTVAVNEWCAQARHESDGLTEKEISGRKRSRASQLETYDLKEDNDPFGIALLESKLGLEQAYEAFKHLESSSVYFANYRSWLLGFKVLLAQRKYVLASQALKKARDFGAPKSQICAGGLMTRYTLEHDSEAPQVLRSLQLKMLPTIVTDGSVVDSDPVEYANTYVTDLVDWIRVRRFMEAIDGVEPAAVGRLQELTDVDDVQEALFELQRAGVGASFAEAIQQNWPRATFVS